MNSEATQLKPDRAPVWLGTGEVRVLVGDNHPETLALYPKLSTLEDMWTESLTDRRLSLPGALLAHVTLAPANHPQGLKDGQLYILGEGHLQLGVVNDTECLRFQLLSTETARGVNFVPTAAPLMDSCLITLQWQPYPFALHHVRHNGLIAEQVPAPVPAHVVPEPKPVKRHGSSAGATDVIGADDHGLHELSELLPLGYSMSAGFLNGHNTEENGWIVTVVGSDGYTATGGVKPTLQDATSAMRAVLRADTVLR